MNRRLMLSVAAVACVLPLAALAKDAPYKAPRTSFGQPDISGAWSNATLTPQARPTLYGTRRVQTPEEVNILEGANLEKAAVGNAKVDVSKDAAVASDNVGAYDRAWVDNGVGVMRVRGEPRTSFITTEDGQVPPSKGAPKRTLPANAGSREAGLQAAKQAASVDMFAGQGSVTAARAGSYDNPESRGIGERCLISFGRNAGPPMFPNGWYNNNYDFIQTPTEVAITVEMVHDMRHIRLNSTHRTDGIRPWFGDSIGWWDGDTLVVETTNIPQRMAYSGSWENLTVTERFTRVAKDRIAYQFSIKDPTMWDKPWGGEYEFYPLKGDTHEYACHEGNYALEGILAGAREEERIAASKARPVAAK
jgi:hypothetical protein